MEDKDIIALFWRRSEEAIQATASKYGKYCYSIAYGITNCGSSYIQESYHPEHETFEVAYPTEEGTKSVLLQDIEWVEFVPYEIGYF